MSFSDFPQQSESVQLLQRSLARQRLGHAYLFHGANLEELEGIAGTLAKTLNCLTPPARSAASKIPLDCCDQCLNCRKIANGNHPDVLWVRAESKSRIITIDQMRELMQTIHLKPTQAEYKVAIVVGADRLNLHAANAFLKTLEEPPSNSVIVLLTTEAQRVLETIVSRCLRLNLAGESARANDPAFLAWLEQFSAVAASNQETLLNRYQLLSVVLNKLNSLREEITAHLTGRSPLQQHEEAESKLRDRWEDELAAAIEAEYRRKRTDLLAGLQWWLRDVWLVTLQLGRDLLSFPTLESRVGAVGRRLSPADALENLEVIEQTQRLLHSNVQEALALEVGLLKLKL